MHVTLGILAGGRATRLGGCDKAWLERDGVPQVVRISRVAGHGCDAILVSANAHAQRLARYTLQAVPDRIADAGPLGGIDALAAACTTDWLFTMPVDMVAVDDRPLEMLMQAGRHGAVAEDDDGLQPLVALYRVDTLRHALASAIATGDYSVRAMQAGLGLPRVRFTGVRFGNLNTPDDLREAGIDP